MTILQVNFTHSTLRERIVEHVFVGDVLRALWKRGIVDVEVLRSEFDAHGYDLVMGRGAIVRHIQFKTQGRGPVNVGRGLADKPSGCVIWIRLNEELDLGPFFWFGGAPGQPLVNLGKFPNPKRTTHNKQGVRPVRHNHHSIPECEFTRLETIDEVLEKLFGQLPGLTTNTDLSHCWTTAKSVTQVEADMAIDPSNLSDEKLNNIIANHRRRGATDAAVYVEALAEQARRSGRGLDFEKSFDIIRHAAAEARFVSYKELADASGANWAKVHYAIGGHLGSLVEYAHRRGWPMVSAIVVNKQNVATGRMEPETLKGFVAAAKELGYSVTDEEVFLRDQQRKVFAWAPSK
jgi:hypothetical protein